MKLSLLILTLHALLACAPGSSKKSPAAGAIATSDGGQDNGGGHTILSTPEQIKESLEVAKKYLEHVFRKDNELHYALKKYKNDPIWKMINKVIIPQPKGIWGYLQKSKIILNEQGPCPSFDNKHADASVAHFKIGSDICLSSYNLQKIPQYSLVKELVSLLIHEAAHLQGYEEKDAQELQKIVNYELNQFSFQFNFEASIQQLRTHYSRSLQFLARAEQLEKQSQNNPRTDLLVGMVLPHLSFMMPSVQQDYMFFVFTQLERYKSLRNINFATERIFAGLLLSFTWNSETGKFDSVLFGDGALLHSLYVKYKLEKTARMEALSRARNSITELIRLIDTHFPKTESVEPYDD